MQTERHVFLYCNYLGVLPISVVAHSFLKSLASTEPVILHIAHDARFAAEGGVERIRSVVGRFPFARVESRNFEPVFAGFANRLSKDENVWSTVVWAWFFCLDLFPDITGNLLVLDWDTLVRHDLSPLFNLDLRAEGCIAAAINESRREDRPYLVTAGWPEAAGHSVNTALMVIDTETYRTEGFRDKMIDWYAAHKDIACCIEQDAFNVICGTRIRRLHPRFNCPATWLTRVFKDNFFRREWRAFDAREALEAMVDPAVIHFIGRKKPWKAIVRPWAGDYRRTMAAIGFNDEHRSVETPAARILNPLSDILTLSMRILAWSLLILRRTIRL